MGSAPKLPTSDAPSLQGAFWSLELSGIRIQRD